jgi:hypothetical protein
VRPTPPPTNYRRRAQNSCDVRTGTTSNYEVIPFGDPLAQGRPISGGHDLEAHRACLIQPTRYVADAFRQHPASLGEPLTDP